MPCPACHVRPENPAPDAANTATIAATTYTLKSRKTAKSAHISLFTPPDAEFTVLVPENARL